MNRSKCVLYKTHICLCGLLSLVILMLAACGTLEVGIESSRPRSSIGDRDAGVAPLPSSTAPISINTLTPSPNTPTPPVILSLPKDLETLSPTPSPNTPTLPPTPSPMPTAAATPIPVSPTPDTPAPQVLSFTAERVAPEGGADPSDLEGIALTWEATGEQATICPLIGDRAVGCRCILDMPLAGSHVIKPHEIVGNYDGFRLGVESGGIRTVRYVPLAVECPDIFAAWFFDGQSPAICPQDPPLTSYAAAQRFEHGLMIWVEASDTYYVLFDHHIGISDNPQSSSSLTSLRVVQGPLDLKPGASADNRVAETPPPNRFEPVSGFGLVWRGEVLGGEGVRDALGWAVEPEYGFDTVYQCAMSCDSYWDCYLQGPEGEIFHVYLLLHVGRFWEVIG